MTVGGRGLTKYIAKLNVILHDKPKNWKFSNHEIKLWKCNGTIF